jgi:hypothetical protein
VDPAVALDTLLRQFGVPAAQISAGFDERIAQWRSQLADRRVLVVLDNAATVAQVTPLLPATPGCVALVTSRRRLVDLDGARPRSVDLLDPQDAITLLERVAGERVRAEPDAAAEVAKRCGYLPWALRLAAARLAHRPHWRVRDLADRLASPRTARRVGHWRSCDRRCVRVVVRPTHLRRAADIPVAGSPSLANPSTHALSPRSPTRPCETHEGCSTSWLTATCFRSSTAAAIGFMTCSGP